MRFPDGFVWGAATSAAQIEGGVDVDGRGPSVWDAFAARPGAIRDGTDAIVAADHRRRWRDDVAVLADLGIAAYRFSVAWPRVQPTGRGAANEPGLDWYRELVDALLAAGIEPVVTLYHWDLPLALEDAGGWPVRATADAFADYAALVGKALGDRVARWCTVNEPWCASMLGYAGGQHAPGRQEPDASVAAAHHLLYGHGLATEALRSSVAVPGREIAISLNPYPVVAAGERPEDLDAARRVDGLANRWWYDALLRGAYPKDVVDDLAAVTDLSFVRDGDLAVIAAPVDALGLNYYRRYHVRHAAGASAVAEWPGSPDVELVTPPGPTTDGGWAIEPEGLTEALLRVTREYDPPPLYVHENGAAFDEPFDDQDRVAFLDAHLRAAHAAIAAGADLRGYFVWSLLDNFEWAEGYRHRFGIVHVDYDTQARTPKASARWYASTLAHNALNG
ncbi:MAG: beta-glucosidase [Acidimicrobiia bacterium]|nr:beta-glucosidase [Acidimicrobiia bacterium]